MINDCRAKIPINTQIIDDYLYGQLYISKSGMLDHLIGQVFGKEKMTNNIWLVAI